MSNVNYEKSKKQTFILFEFFTNKVKKMIGRESLYLSGEEILIIYQHLLNFFENDGTFTPISKEDLRDGIIKKRVNLVPISQILSTSEMNNINLEPFTKPNIKRGKYGIVSMDNSQPNRVEKIRQFRVKNEGETMENIRTKMNVSRLFMGDIIPINETQPDYMILYKRFHYLRDINYNPAQILIANLIQDYCHHYAPHFIPQVNESIFYKTVCKTNMERVKGYEIYDVTNSLISGVISHDLISFKSIVLQNFSKVLWGIFSNLASLYHQIGFVHLDLHYHNIFIQNDIVKAFSKNRNNPNLHNAGFLLSCAKIIDFDTSYITIPLLDQSSNRGFRKKIIRNYVFQSSMFQEQQYIEGKLYWKKRDELMLIYYIYKYLDPSFNPILTSLYSQLKLIFTILFGVEEVGYEVEPSIEDLIVRKLGIVEGYRDRMVNIENLYCQFKRIGKGNLFNLRHRIVPCNFKLRNYLLFNVPLPNMRYVPNIQRIFSFIDENFKETEYNEYSSRFIYENLIRVFST